MTGRAWEWDEGDAERGKKKGEEYITSSTKKKIKGNGG